MIDGWYGGGEEGGGGEERYEWGCYWMSIVYDRDSFYERWEWRVYLFLLWKREVLSGWVKKKVELETWILKVRNMKDEIWK